MEMLLTTPVMQGATLLWIDVIAVSWFFAGWVGYVRFTDERARKNMNLHACMARVRAEWMTQMLTRDNRVVDSNLIGNLLRSISFFASTSIFLLIGLVTILGHRTDAMEILSHVPYSLEGSNALFDFKILLLAVIFIYAFFKYTWSLRQYNYACILVGAAPNPKEKPETHEAYSTHAGELISNAGRHFNMGLRAYYFGLAAIAWFIHPVFFMGVTALVIVVVYRREFQSHTAITLRNLYEKCHLSQ